mgnify:CR=1 FL=1
MGSIKGTQTEKNLLKSFAGESQARNRYTYFASKAKKEGYDDTHPNADSFKEGYRRGKNTRDEKNTDNSGETRKKVRKEYEGKEQDDKDAYKKGYAAGSNKG